MNNHNLEAIIWDLGGVLIDWNPRYLYSKIFRSDHAMEYFLSYICTSEWNEEQDGGRSFQEGTELLIRYFPEYENEVRAFYARWTEMLGGDIIDTVNILKHIKLQKKYKQYALTNWSAESFPVALERYEFLQLFDGILVSGVEKLKKPDPAIYQLLLSRYGLNAGSVIFIDDNLRNVKAARNLGITSIHFTNPPTLIEELSNYKIWNA